MKGILKKFLITSIITIALLGVGSYFLMKQGKEIRNEQEKLAQQELDLVSDEKKTVYEERTITKLDLDFKEPALEDVYLGNYTELKNKEIKKKKKKNLYDFESPLWAWDLYGTNHLSAYLYFKVRENSSLRYTIQVEDSNIPNFTRTLNNGNRNNLTKEHEYQLIGFVPGMRNIVVLELLDEKGELLNRRLFSINVPSISSKVDVRNSIYSGRSEETISNGLYTIFTPKWICLYDNSGVIRSEIPIYKRTTQTMVNADDTLCYGIDKQHVVRVNRLGGVKQVYSLGTYEQYGQLLYNGYGSLWILASESGKKNNSVKDSVVSLDLKSKKVSKLFSMDDLLPEAMKLAKKQKGKKLDWISLNWMTQINSDEVIVSSRELSSLFKVVRINSRSPRVSYIIGEKKIWKKTSYKKRLLDKTGQKAVDEEQASKQSESLVELGEAKQLFLASFGQSYIQVEKDSSLGEGQYYLYVWDSNYGYSPTRKDIPWKNYSGVGTPGYDARVSIIKKYLVDENTVEYDLKSKKEVLYTKENGNMQYYGEHRIDSYGSLKQYAEYDSTGKMIRKYNYSYDGITHIEKNKYYDFWFYLQDK